MNRLTSLKMFLIANLVWLGLGAAVERPMRSNENDGLTYASHSSVYLLISTSSKIYCMKMPDDADLFSSQQSSQQYYYRNNYYERDSKNYAVIYEEKNHQSNWITDAFYVKSENLIYVNVYNSTSATSDIFTLKYDQAKDQWIKNVLYRDQSYCLGITYNEQRKELYWTAAKSIVSGSSHVTGQHSNPSPPQLNHVLFKLQAAKKLLYLKYDPITETIYVSTLNYVYACSLQQTQRDDCRIIARDLQSARGLFLDSVNRYLYVVDHKKKVIKRINLAATSTQNAQNEVITTVLSSETTPDIGDIFYMTIYDKSGMSKLVWSEFSGKIKMSNLNDASNYKVIFSTNEYTYSINLMDNSTFNLAPLIRSTTPHIQTSPVVHTTRVVATTTPPILTSRIMPKETTSIQILSTTSPELVPQTTQPLLSWTRHRIQTSSTSKTTTTTQVETTTVDEILNNEILITSFYSDRNTNTELEPTTEPVELEEELEDTSEEQITTSIETTIPTTEPMTSSTPVEDNSKLEFRQNLKKDEASEIETEPEITQELDQIQNFKAVNVIKSLSSNDATSLITPMPVQELSSSSSFTLSRASPQLNVALYIVICLLCFSLIINIILLYVSKMKQSRDKLIITHEICGKPLVNTPSQRSGIDSTKTCNLDDMGGECNMNLINSNGSATSGIDGEQ